MEEITKLYGSMLHDAKSVKNILSTSLAEDLTFGLAPNPVYLAELDKLNDVSGLIMKLLIDRGITTSQVPNRPGFIQMEVNGEVHINTEERVLKEKKKEEVPVTFKENEAPKKEEPKPQKEERKQESVSETNHKEPIKETSEDIFKEEKVQTTVGVGTFSFLIFAIFNINFMLK